MRSEAYKISGFTVVVAALGFMLRWLQNMRILDEETGLASRAPISGLVGGLIVLVALGLAGYVLYLHRYEAPTEAEQALEPHTPLFAVIALVPAVLLIIAGMAQTVQRDIEVWPLLHRLNGVATMLVGLGAALIATSVTNREKGKTRRTGSALMVVCACFWLVTAYRDAATDPVVWRFVVEVIAGCLVLLAFHYMSGYFFCSPHPWMTLFTCNMGAVICIMCAIDDNSLAQSLTYAATAMTLLIWGFVITENLKTKPLHPTEKAEG